jgi:DNA-binding XRE family transcriptional regulator
MKERFKEIRQKRKMTQQQFAELLGTNQQSITDMEEQIKLFNKFV